MSAEFVPVPDWPAYEINNAGVVRSRFGELVPRNGTVYLYNSDRHERKRLHISHLLELAGLSPEKSRKAKDKLPAKAGQEDARTAAMELENAKLNRKLAFQRRLNATFWQRLRRLEAELPDLEPDEGRKRIRAQRDEWFEEMPEEWL